MELSIVNRLIAADMAIESLNYIQTMILLQGVFHSLVIWPENEVSRRAALAGEVPVKKF